MVEAWLVRAARKRVAEFTSDLRTLSGSNGSVPGLDWTVADLAQHVCGLPAYWDAQNDGQADWTLPSDFAAFSDAARAHITDTEIEPLSLRIDTEFDTFISSLADGPEQRWLYGVPMTTTHMCGLVLNELILHGRDLAAVTGGTPPMYETNEANAAVDAMMVSVPCFIDATKAAAQPDGVYHVHFRGGQHYTWTKAGGALTIEPGRPAKADAHMNADPATFLMASLGRIGQVRASISGKMIVYGRKPWRFIGLGKIAIDGV